MVDEFVIKDLGNLKYFPGMEVARSREGISVSSRKHILDLLKVTCMIGYVDTCIEFNAKLRDYVDKVPVDKEEKLTGNALRFIPTLIGSLTFEGVRRLLEKDLCMETYTLDVHKRYVKQCLVKCLEADLEDNVSKDSELTGRKSVNKEEMPESPEGHQSKKGAKEPCLEDEEKLEDSPVMGLLTGRSTKNVESDGIKGIKGKDDKDVPSESTIMKAIRKRTSYLKANSEKVTMAGVRRLLEDDLKLTKNALDSCKKLISQQVEEILTSCEAAEKVSNLKTPKKVSKESSHSTEGSSSEEENDEVNPGKTNATKGRILDSNETKKRKRSTKKNVSAKKQRKHVQDTSDEDSDEGGENVSEDDQSGSSNEKPVKKEVSSSTPVYGKRVEHLKSVIKSCGMSVPPSIYKKVKQAPESKRESQLIKELEGILSREGLSANPTEKGERKEWSVTIGCGGKK
ncbi:glutamic acid-rich protein isoform X2 [Cucumis melo var. makuwa]|uniref:Glutamic acid-rich protein isoform X2 n=1 Tax=Cucumis melo var. makuwa TaxID=1194695 RepID=A0A5A7UXJ2_CUCMM|nr:glutamic acid-rich protein isoform X2 [Cucumis melo var. makuwa]TYK24822.1 glutamic acid-rich protein isoform X2 [Cucumis melo var. makuwa]